MYFVRLNKMSLWHVYADLILPLLEALDDGRGATHRREVYWFPPGSAAFSPLSHPHFAHLASSLGSMRPAQELFGTVARPSRRTCLSHLGWGIGAKAFYSTSVRAMARNVAHLRSLFRTPAALLGHGAHVAGAAGGSGGAWARGCCCCATLRRGRPSTATPCALRSASTRSTAPLTRRLPSRWRRSAMRRCLSGCMAPG